MNFLQYYVFPRKLLTSMTDLGIGKFTMTDTLEGSIFSSPPPTMWPKYTKEVFLNSHLYIFINNYSFLKTSNTFLTCLTCSSCDLLNIKISYKQKITNSSRKDPKTSFITLMNVVGALQTLKGITNHSNNPYLVLKQVFQMSSSAILT